MLTPQEAADLARSLDAASSVRSGPRGGSEALSPLMPFLRSLFGAEACSVAILDGDEIRFVAADGGAGQELIGQAIPVGRGIAGWAVLSGSAVAVADVAADPRFAREFAEAVGYLPGEILAAPVRAGEEVIGVVEVLDPRRGFEDRGRDLDVLETLAAFIGSVWVSAEDAAVPVRAFLQSLTREASGLAAAVAPDEDLARLAADLRAVAAVPGAATLTHEVLRAIAEFLPSRGRE